MRHDYYGYDQDYEYDAPERPVRALLDSDNLPLIALFAAHRRGAAGWAGARGRSVVRTRISHPRYLDALYARWDAERDRELAERDAANWAAYVPF